MSNNQLPAIKPKYSPWNKGRLIGQKRPLLAKQGGAIWSGQSYSSLSAVARAMTGTNRNGPKFFGLREGNK